MKKLILLLFVGVMVATAYWFHSTSTALNDLLLENVEALAAGESSENIRCAGTGSVDCPINHSKVYAIYGGYSLETLY